MKATAMMGNMGNDEGEAPAPANSNGVKPIVKAKGKLPQKKSKAKDVNALAAPSPASSDYSKDPDKGERPYHEHEVKDMAHHVVNAMAIIHHPHKSKAVQQHFSSQKMHAKTFDQLKAHISSEMD